MDPRPISFFQQSIQERRRREVARVEDMTAKDSTVSGRHLIMGTGQVTFDVTFPLTFNEKPLFHYGWELDVNQYPVDQAFPGGYAFVYNWATVGQVDGAFEGYFTGATIGALVFGASNDQRLWLHWSFRGTGLRNPVKPDDLLEDEL